MAAPEQFDQLHQGKRSPNGGLHGLAYPTRSRAAADNGAQTQQRRSSKVEPEKGTKKTNKLPNSTNKTTAPGTSERPTEPFDQNGGGSGWFNPLTAGKQISQREKEKTTTMADLSVLSFFLSFSLFFFVIILCGLFGFLFFFPTAEPDTVHSVLLGFPGFLLGFERKKGTLRLGFRGFCVVSVSSSSHFLSFGFYSIRFGFNRWSRVFRGFTGFCRFFFKKSQKLNSISSVFYRHLPSFLWVQLDGTGFYRVLKKTRVSFDRP